MAAYEAAMGGETVVPASAGAKRTKPGTIDALVVSYYQSTEYRNLKPITQRIYRSVMEPFRQQRGHRLLRDLQREHVKAIVAKLADRPSASNNWLKAIKILMRHAVEVGMRRDDPTTGLRKMRTGSTGYRT